MRRMKKRQLPSGYKMIDCSRRIGSNDSGAQIGVRILMCMRWPCFICQQSPLDMKPAVIEILSSANSAAIPDQTDNTLEGR